MTERSYWLFDLAGVVDSDYRGNVQVVLFNFSDSDFIGDYYYHLLVKLIWLLTVKRGDRIAQLVCEKIEMPDLEEVDELDETVRSDGGFGSTGIWTSWNQWLLIVGVQWTFSTSTLNAML